MSATDIEIIPAGPDNYQYLVLESDSAAVIDPSEPVSIQRALARHGLTLSLILVTHHHHDHVAGVSELVDEFHAEVAGADDPRIPRLTHVVGNGDGIDFSEGRFRVLETPGHGDRDVSYCFTRPGHPDALFCGDTLFISGCGRILEGTVSALWSSLRKLAALPDETELYCGHEYTEENLRFALSLEPSDPVYRARADEVSVQRRAHQPSVPGTMGTERRANPFLRCRSLEEFAALRNRKDRF